MDIFHSEFHSLNISLLSKNVLYIHVWNVFLSTSIKSHIECEQIGNKKEPYK